MVSPLVPHYDPPDVAPAGGDTKDPDAGKDLSYLVPVVTVAWDTPPSFNLPPDSDQDGDEQDKVKDCGPIFMDAGSVRAAESSVLGQLRTATAAYEEMRARVLSLPDTLFAPPPPPKAIASMNAGSPGNSSGAAPMADGQTDPEGTKAVAEMGRQFADAIKPMMEKTLFQIANSLTLTGQFLGLVNQGGQSYADLDRAVVFPEPPTGSVTD